MVPVLLLPVSLSLSVCLSEYLFWLTSMSFCLPAAAATAAAAAARNEGT